MSTIINRKNPIDFSDWSKFDTAEDKVPIVTGLTTETRPKDKSIVVPFSNEDEDRLYTIIRLFPDAIENLHSFFLKWCSEGRFDGAYNHSVFLMHFRIIDGLILDKKLYIKSPIKFMNDITNIKKFLQEKYDGKCITTDMRELIMKLEKF